GGWPGDAASGVLTLGARAAAIHGLAARTRTAWQDLRGLLHPDDREPQRGAVERALRDRSDYGFQYRLQSGDRHEVWISASGRGLYGADGSVTGMTGVVADITERKRAEIVRGRLAEVVESSDDAILSKDLSGVIQ